MSDSYRAIYDAVRSRICGGDIGDILRDVARDALDVSWQKSQAQQEIANIGMEWVRPSVLFRPSISVDGNKWCALYGPDLAEGVAGFGDTPAEAMADFDKNWNTERPHGGKTA